MRETEMAICRFIIQDGELLVAITVSTMNLFFGASQFGQRHCSGSMANGVPEGI